MQNSDQKDDDFSDIEEALMKMQPIAPSESFCAAVEAAMNEPDGNAVAFPHRGCFLNFVTLRRFVASAAFFAAAVGVGIWSYFALPLSGEHRGTVNPDPSAALLAASGAAERHARGNYSLVNVERRMNSVEPTEIVSAEDGTLARRVRYLYMDEYRWEDKETGSAFVELRPHERIISMEMPVY